MHLPEATSRPVAAWRRFLRFVFGGPIQRLLWLSFACLVIALIVIVTVYYLPAAPLPRSQMRVLELGWQTPRLQRLPDHIETAQTTPFDGLILDTATTRHRGMAWAVFGSDPIPQAEFDTIAASVDGLAWGRLTDNFLRMNVSPADIDWYDSWDTLLANVEAWARLAHDLGFVGLMFDTEQYNDVDLFNYESRPYRDRYSAAEYEVQAYLRGQAVMTAINRGFPGLTVLLTFGLSSQTFHPARYALLMPFVEGLIAAADDTTTLVDAFAAAYDFWQDEQFRTARALIQGITRDAFAPDPERYAAVVRVGFGLWPEHHCDERGLLPGQVGRLDLRVDHAQGIPVLLVAGDEEDVGSGHAASRGWGQRNSKRVTANERPRAGLPTAGCCPG